MEKSLPTICLIENKNLENAKKLKKINTEKMKKHTEKWAIELYRKFSEERQMAKKYFFLVSTILS